MNQVVHNTVLKKQKLDERKRKYRKLLELLTQGHNPHSASKLCDYSTSYVYSLIEKPYFKRKLDQSRRIINGKVTKALVKRATGYKVTEAYQQLDKFGDVHDLTSTKSIPADVAAIKLWLTNQDKENWQDSDKPEYNPLLINVSTDQLLLTLATGGRGQVVESDVIANTSTTLTTLSTSLPSTNPNKDTSKPNTDSQVVEIATDSTINRGYDPAYDNFWESRKSRGRAAENFHDSPSSGESTPTEGEFDNLGEDSESEE